MPFTDFDVARRQFAAARGDDTVEPVTFALCGETFTALREPMWGDVLQLWDAPEMDEDEARATLALQKFVRAMIEPADRPRWDAAMFRLKNSEAGMTMLSVGSYITEHMTGFPTMPPAYSSHTPPSTGGIFNESSGGDTTSLSSQPQSDAPSPTPTSSEVEPPTRSGRSTEL